MDNECNSSLRQPADITSNNSNNYTNNNNLNSNSNNIYNSQAAASSNNKQQQQQQQQEQQQKSCLKPKPITHRSQSSPSSLTTHKFGLRPTPSPPRLIIDHQTGDIIESYPEQPVYLRTYQPLDDCTNSQYTADLSVAEDDYSAATSNLDSLATQQTQSCPAAAGNKQPTNSSSAANQQYLSSGDDEEPPTAAGAATASASDSAMGRESHRNQPARGFIPPPHAQANKVYFAPPMPSAGHLFHHDDDDDDDDFGEDEGSSGHERGNGFVRDEDPISRRNRERDRLQMNHHHPNPNQSHQSLQHPSVVEQTTLDNSPFKRAISKLNESHPKATTDIALVTHPDAESSQKSEIKILTTPKLATNNSNSNHHNHNHNLNSNHNNSNNNNNNNNSSNSRQMANSGKSNVATSSSSDPKVKARYLSSTEEDNKSANKRCVDQDPSLESFGLYSFCYLFRVVLTVFLSCLIIYLLAVPLHTDCTKYRPTFTYISLIIGSVNLICLTIFSLFWYCNGVTRHLYSNLSSSAFIVTIYSILVAINLAIAIVFFLIGTCHFQRLINTPQQQQQQPNSAVTSLRVSPVADSFLVAPETTTSAATVMVDEIDRRDRRHLEAYPPQVMAGGDVEENLELANDESHTTYTMSPWEAGWEYTKEQTELLLRAFHRFLLQYDLRFIGALHALCAICFQYLAIKVAVVRSYFSYAPLGRGGNYV